MKKSLLYLLLFPCLILSCSVPADTPMNEKSPSAVKSTGRFEITRIGVFEDDLAYDARRGIYIIKDIETGKEYFGVSGIGITEIGSHSTGKIYVTDER